MRQFFWLAAGLLAFFSSDARAQDYMPLALELYPRTSIVDAPTEATEVSLGKIGIGFGVPINIGETRVSIGARYEGLKIDVVNEEGLQLIPPDGLHYARVEIRLSRDIGANWSLALAAAPGIASDFDEVGSDDWRMLGNVLATRRVSRRLAFGFGAAYTSDFGSPLVLPLAKLRWRSEGRLRIEGLLPLCAYAGFEISPGTEIGIAARASGTQYNVNVDQSEHNLPDAPESFDLSAKYSVIAVGPVYKQRVRGPFYISLDAGVTLKRRFEFVSDAVDLSLDQESSGYIRAGVFVRSGVQ